MAEKIPAAMSSNINQKLTPAAEGGANVAATFLQQQDDFSLVLGGPLFQLLLRSHLAGDALELARRRLMVFFLLTWVPLLALSAFHGDALGASASVPFLFDFEVNVRYLIFGLRIF